MAPQHLGNTGFGLNSSSLFSRKLSIYILLPNKETPKMPIVVRDCNDMSPEEIKAKVKELGKPAFLKFSSENCGPCEDLKEKLSQYKTDLEINIFEICRTRTASYPSLWDEFDITAFPTVVLVGKDMKEIKDKNRSQDAPTRIIGSNIKKFEELVKEHGHLFEQSTSQ